MSKVWIVQENNRMDYSPAERFGRVVFMTADEYRPQANSLLNQSTREAVERAAQRVEPEDWVVLTGNPVMMGYVFHLVLQRLGAVRCLQWNRIRGEYQPHVFERSSNPATTD